MWTIKTIKDSALGGFDTVVVQNDNYEVIRKKWFRLVRRYGEIFVLKFNN